LKKIIFTVTNDLTYDQRMQRICSTLASAGYDVLLVGRRLKHSPPFPPASYRQRRLGCWFVKGKFFYAEYNIRLFFYLLIKKTDCICAIDLDTILPVYFASVLKRTKRVYDAHEFFSQLDEVVSRPAIYRFWHWVERKMIHRFRYGYTVSESLAAEFKKYYGASYEVIRNVPVLQETDTHSKSPGIVLYQGAVNKGRGLEYLAAAMKDVNALLWVCGDGNFMDEMKTAVAINSVSDKVKFFGMLAPEALRAKTEAAMIAVNPFDKRGLNQYLSLSNKFFDYIHSGTPQVTMNYPEYRKINKQFEVAELIDDLEPGTIAGALSKLLNNTLLYDRLRQNCLRARQELCWQKEKQRLLDFYSKLRNE